uniref:Secreted protein n=1 Tax=Steinernema glaseri TaxID=37863 RepID=A0A1I7ZQW1_9BILA
MDTSFCDFELGMLLATVTLLLVFLLCRSPQLSCSASLDFLFSILCLSALSHLSELRAPIFCFSVHEWLIRGL